MAIVGQNGSGKSTLLQLVCGTLSPSAGNVRIAGRIAALLELGAGFNTEFSGRGKHLSEWADAIPAGYAALADMSQVAVARDVDASVTLLSETYAATDELGIRRHPLRRGAGQPAGGHQVHGHYRSGSRTVRHRRRPAGAGRCPACGEACRPASATTTNHQETQKGSAVMAEMSANPIVGPIPTSAWGKRAVCYQRRHVRHWNNFSIIKHLKYCYFLIIIPPTCSNFKIYHFYLSVQFRSQLFQLFNLYLKRD